VIPYIGLEIIAALCNKVIPARNQPVIGGSLTNRIAKTAPSLIARFVSGLQATKAKKTVDSQPPSTHASAATYSSSQHKDTRLLEQTKTTVRTAEFSGYWGGTGHLGV
jgi:hypothetical protein